MKRERNKGASAKGCRPSRIPTRVQAMIEAARSPFERYCLLKLSFLEFGRARRSAERWERVVRCEFCGNWHLVDK